MDDISRYMSGSDEDDKPSVTAAPEVSIHDTDESYFHDAAQKSVSFNTNARTLHAPVLGPTPADAPKGVFADKNTLSGKVQQHYMNDTTFWEQFHNYRAYGYAVDPRGTGVIGDVEKVEQEGEVDQSRKKKRKRRVPFGKAGEGIFHGPWAPMDDAKLVLEQRKVAEEEHMTTVEVEKKKQKVEEEVVEKEEVPTSVYHGKESEFKDYLGRTFMDPPTYLRPDAEFECFAPKKLIHTWTGHTKGVTAIRFFPRYAHLLLSASMDHTVKIWDVYNDRKCLRTYMKHFGAVRDICFSNDGRQFLSCGYDRQIVLWDTEYGKVLRTFSDGAMPYCVVFNPDEDKQNMFLVGTSAKKVVQYNTDSGEVMQEYAEHLSAVNSVTFVDYNRKFVTTSDDKTVRVWEFGIPATVKMIQEPWMHSMPSVSISPCKKWLSAQSLDNQIFIYHTDRVRQHKKKHFKGHQVSGYACQTNFSPDGEIVMSGDGNGFLWFWDWKRCRIIKKIKAHDRVTIGCVWNPLETSKVASCSWDGTIKYWD